MKCCEPKIIPIISPDGVVCFSFQRCGNCYACQCGKRGEMVVRMDHELKDSYNKSKFFITLTYSDRYLPVALSPEEWRLLSDYYHDLPIAYRRYDYCVLEPWRLSKFLKDIQDDFKVTYCHGRFDKHHNAITDEQDVHIRYFATGEYGDISHRAHYHMCLLFPRDVHWQDCINLVRSHWNEGCINVQPLQTKGACNYVAKHQVKECIGSEFQQKCAPVFARYSIYGGGIGRCMKNDKVMKERYLNSLKTRDKSNLCYFVYQGDKKFAVSIPRFLIKEWHPDRFSTDELIMSQKEGFENLAQFIFDNLNDNCYLSPEFRDAFEFIDWQLENFTSDYRYTYCNDVDYQNFEQLEAISTVLKVVSKPLIVEDKRRKVVYVNKHISSKLSKIKENIYTDYSMY